MAAPLWLTARPIAHRGLHDRAKRVIENTCGAARAAIAHDYAIECDVGLTLDEELIVFHDDRLERLTDGTGDIAEKSLAELKALKLKDSDERIPTLQEFLDVIADRVPLVLEIKSRFDGETEIVRLIAQCLSQYQGRVAIKSFDPEMIVATRALMPDRPRGFIGESVYDDPEWDILSAERKAQLIAIDVFNAMSPVFLSLYIKDLDHPTVQMVRRSLGIPVMSWTIRTDENREKAKNFADQMVFEGFQP
jgi:glycerophosphoryl diester phosphodiesterase